MLTAVGADGLLVVLEAVDVEEAVPPPPPLTPRVGAGLRLRLADLRAEVKSSAAANVDVRNDWLREGGAGGGGSI